MERLQEEAEADACRSERSLARGRTLLMVSAPAGVLVVCAGQVPVEEMLELVVEL